MIAIIDYDAGNLKSVEKALVYIGQQVIVTKDRDEILKADHVILPGVGAFSDAMEKLNRFGLTEVIYEVVERQIPLLGICLGLQLLFESSEEGRGVKGLSILEGEILKIPNIKDLKIPHIGWNSLEIKKDARLFQGIKQGSYVYFVHSYYLKAKKEEEVTTITT